MKMLDRAYTLTEVTTEAILLGQLHVVICATGLLGIGEHELARFPRRFEPAQVTRAQSTDQ
jgi:hypothetical protein